MKYFNFHQSEVHYILYYEVFCPFCRQIRILMDENELNPSIIKFNRYREDENSRNFLINNPHGKNPLIGIVLNDLSIESRYSNFTDKDNLNQNIDMGYHKFSTSYNNDESNANNTMYVYGFWNAVNLVNTKKNLIPSDIYRKILTNNIFTIINVNFYDEVVSKIIYEKITKYFISKTTPNSLTLNQTRQDLNKYLKIFSRLINDNTKLTSENISIADVSLFAHFSILDYINEIDWNSNLLLKEWYLLMKSRPNFRNILNDFIPGFAPSYTYKSLDF